MSSSPRWLDRLERPLGWIAIPNIAVLIVTLQACGFFFVSMDPVWVARLALLPGAVLRGGEYWRLVTFLALPLTLNIVWLFFVLWFLYFILNTLENVWGAFKTTIYVLVSVLVTIVFSLATGYPVTQMSHFESTLFLAAAGLFPDMEVRLFLAIPVKMKWMAWVTGVFLLLELLKGSWLDRAYLFAIYSNFVLFFGPALFSGFRQSIRRRNFQRKLRG